MAHALLESVTRKASAPPAAPVLSVVLLDAKTKQAEGKEHIPEYNLDGNYQIHVVTEDPEQSIQYLRNIGENIHYLEH